MGSPEFGRVIPVNATEKTTNNGLLLSAVGETYVPRELDPTTTTDHEGIHAGLGEVGDVDFVTNIAGKGYKGLTKFNRPNALAALGPHAVGAQGTSWDVKVASHIGGGSLSAARHAVSEKHAEIVEISDALAENRTLRGKDVDAARERAWMKKKYGVNATVIARAETGEEIRVRMKVEGDKTVVPIEVVDFSARLQEKLAKEEAARIEKQREAERLETVRAELVGMQQSTGEELTLAA